ncbi:hypothetical protein Leryth_026429 [Lithospermum erythrorhizon]|nr:hypothetical protein Leryth_026429 [Lithospermum erythrorhizon]
MGIDLKAGGKVKKTKRTAPKSNDIYLKLLVKVAHEQVKAPLPSLLRFDLIIARARIEKAGGECLTFDQLALRAPLGQNTV